VGRPSPSMDFELKSHVARGFRERLVGLAWSGTPRAAALLLPRCRSVHTFGMRFALDLFWLDASGEVVRVDHGVRPWRIARCRAARSVIEVPS
jgi:uncharacterized membrane protein (UPF0127 family)